MWRFGSIARIGLSSMSSTDTKIIVGLASLCSAISIVAVLVVVPSLYTTIDQIQTRVNDGVQVNYTPKICKHFKVFRVNTDSAWSQLMEVLISVTPPSEPRENPFKSIFAR